MECLEWTQVTYLEKHWPLTSLRSHSWKRRDLSLRLERDWVLCVLSTVAKTVSSFFFFLREILVVQLLLALDS